VLEQQRWTSYAACGIPYWIAGDAEGPNGLVARTPEQHRANGLDLHTETTVTSIDPSSGRVTAEPTGGGEACTYVFDHLVLATGAEAITPPIPGADLPGVSQVHTLDDGLVAIDNLHANPEHAVVVGAGYVGIEMAEACRIRGLKTTILDIAAEPMASLDPDMSALVRSALADGGVTLRSGVAATEIREGAQGRVIEVDTETVTIAADIVFLGVGARPRTELARAAGISVGRSGGLLTNAKQQVLGFENVWAAGDCVESYDRLIKAPRYVPLGTHANKQGRVVGMNIAGDPAEFAGIVGTAITKFLGTEISRTGLRETEARDLGMAVATAKIDALTHAGYYPGAEPMTVKLIGELGSGRLLGGQIVGGAGAGMRIDIVAAALWGEMNVSDVLDMDLAYAPPFSAAWDPVQIAARQLVPKL
jgi:NADPH-dependent 2,4-dienoyl-CoA reductase/sulfur reductase-like enzyme